MTVEQRLSELSTHSPRLAAKLRQLPPQQLQELLQTKDNK